MRLTTLCILNMVNGGGGGNRTRTTK